MFDLSAPPLISTATTFDWGFEEGRLIGIFFNFVAESAPRSGTVECRFRQEFHRLIHILWIQFDSNEFSVQTPADQSNCSAAEKWIEHEVSRVCCGENTRFHQFLWKRGDVAAVRWGRVDAPDAPPVSFAAVFSLLQDGMSVVVIFLFFAEHEYVLVRSGRTIFHALGHGVRLVPNNIASQIPAVRLQGKGEPPWNADQIFVFQARRVIGPDRHRAIGILFVRSSPAAVPARVAVTDIQPENSVGFQNSAQFGKNVCQLVNITCESWFEPDLSLDPIIPKPPIRRRGYDALN